MEKTLAYIHGLYRKGTKPDLSRVRWLLSALGDPQKRLKVIHIAGTNGKGSTAAMSAAILRQAGYKRVCLHLLISIASTSGSRSTDSRSLTKM